MCCIWIMDITQNIISQLKLLKIVPPKNPREKIVINRENTLLTKSKIGMLL